MERPYIAKGIKKPYESDYKKRKIQVKIYSYDQKQYRDNDETQHCYYCDEEDCNETCEEALEEKSKAEGSHQPVYLTTPLEKTSLQDILDRIPKGIKISDVKMESYVHEFSGVDHLITTFYYTKTIPSNMKQFKKDKAIYDKAYAEWEVKNKEYAIWEQEQKVKELEEKIAKIKSGKGPIY